MTTVRRAFIRITCSAAIAVAGMGVASAAQAGVCGGAEPAQGESLRGPVLEVIDGAHLCVARTPDPSTWVAVRLADAPPAPFTDGRRGALMAASFGQDVTCRIVGHDGDGAVAECLGEAGSIGRDLGSARVIKAAQTWR